MKSAILIFGLSLGLVSCGGSQTAIVSPNNNGGGGTTDNNPPQEPTSFSNSGGVITLANSKLQLKWETTHGTLVGLKNLTTGKEWITGATKGNWILFVNTGTTSQWSASLGTEYFGSQGVTPTVSTTTVENGIRLNFRYGTVGGMDITVVVHVTLLNNSPVSTWVIEVENNTSTTTGGVVTAVIAPQVNGVGFLSGESLALPYHDGEIIPNPGTSPILVTYPTPLSMQWMDLYNSSEGLYYAVLDPAAVHKEFRFGYDSVVDPSPDQSRIMSTVLWAFVEPSRAYVSPPVEVAAHSEGGWWWGADRYRNFITRAWMPVKHYSSAAAEMAAFGGILLTSGDQYATTMPSQTALLSQRGISHDLIFGWNYGDFDNLYPDFDIDPGKGGESGLRSGITAVHEQGNRISLYVNAWDVDSTSNWYQSQLPLGKNNTRNVDGTYPPGFPLSGHQAYPASPSAIPYQDQLVDTISRLRSLGTDFQYFDQVMEAPAYFDYNPDHGMSSPATAYSEGYPAMFRRFHQAFNGNGLRNDYYFVAEGIDDYLSPYIDVAALMWARGIGYDPGTVVIGQPAGVDAPQVTRYTIPTVILGNPHYGYTLSDSDIYAWAFLMGEPLSHAGPTSAFPRYLNIYKNQPDVYFYGTYKDSRGLKLDNTNVWGTTIVGKDSDRLAIQLWNRSGNSQTVTVTLDYSKIGLDGATVTGARNLEGGSIPYTAGTDSVSFSASVPARDVKAFLITLDGGIEADSHYYTLTNVNSGLNLDVAGGSTSDLANVQQDTASGGTSQRWQIHDVGNGFFELIAECSGMALDVNLGSTSEGQNVDQSIRNGSKAQMWRIERVRGGYRLTAATGKALSVAGGSTASMANVDQEAWTESPAQIWTITGQGGSTPPLLPEGRTWMIYAKASDLAMEGFGDINTPGQPIEQNTPAMTAAQQWTIQSLETGYYKINLNGGFALSVRGDSAIAGAIVESDSYSGGCGQNWQIDHIRDGFYALASSCNSGLILTVTPNSLEPPTHVDLELAPTDPTSTPDNQLWRLVLQNP